MAGEIVIVGLGQTLRGDDAVGLEAVRLWERSYPATAGQSWLRVEYAESPGLTLLSLLEGADVALLVDAVQSGAPPGTLHFLDEADWSAFLQGAASAHGWGVAETLAIGRQSGVVDLPARIVLLGIEIGQVEVGADLSPALRETLPRVAHEIEHWIQSEWNERKQG